MKFRDLGRFYPEAAFGQGCITVLLLGPVEIGGLPSDIAWVTKNGERYLQLTVNGKTGRRTSIASHNTADYLARLQQRRPTIAKYTFDKLLKKKINEKVFVLEDGTKTNSLAGTFRNLMRDSGLDKDRTVKEKRTLYSLRHTYAHFALLKERMDVYTLAKQMGTSVKMIEQHYGHLNPTMQADVIAGKRYVPKPVEMESTADEQATLEPSDAKKPAAKPRAEKSLPRTGAKGGS